MKTTTLDGKQEKAAAANKPTAQRRPGCSEDRGSFSPPPLSVSSEVVEAELSTQSVVDSHSHSHRGQVSLDTGDANGPSDDVAELLQRVTAYESGTELVGFNVELPIGSLPPQSFAARELARKIGIVMSLRLGDGRTTPVAISERFAARLLHLPDPNGTGRKRASSMLSVLERHRVIRNVGALPRQGEKHGARLYEPDSRTLDSIWFDSLPEHEQVAVRALEALDRAEATA